jgi:hypothetical protein
VTEDATDSSIIDRLVRVSIVTDGGRGAHGALHGYTYHPDKVDALLDDVHARCTRFQVDGLVDDDEELVVVFVDGGAIGGGSFESYAYRRDDVLPMLDYAFNNRAL